MPKTMTKRISMLRGFFLLVIGTAIVFGVGLVSSTWDGLNMQLTDQASARPQKEGYGER